MTTTSAFGAVVVLAANGLMNVPKEGLFNWDPGAKLGIYPSDTFY